MIDNIERTKLEEKTEQHPLYHVILTRSSLPPKVVWTTTVPSYADRYCSLQNRRWLPTGKASVVTKLPGNVVSRGAW